MTCLWSLFRYRLSLPLILVAITSCVWAVGCARRETVVQRGNREQILHRGSIVDVSELDPQLITGADEADVVIALFEGLVTEDPQDLHPVPGVAESWDVSPDGLTYTFHLRANAKWSNGDSVTASDFVHSYQRLLTPSLAANYAYLLYIIRNAEAFNKGQLTDFSQVGLESSDPRTFRITLEHPCTYFLSLLNHWAWLPVPISTIQKYGPIAQRGNPWTRPGQIVSNGAFVLKEWRHNQVVIVEKNSNYWDARHVRLKAIRFHAIESLDTEERSFRAGQIHLTDAIPVSKIDNYRQQQPTVLRIDPYVGVYFYRFNVNRPFLNDSKVRRALALAVDRERIVTDIFRGAEYPSHAFTPPDTGGYTPTSSIATDFAEARKLLADAGYPGGKGLPPLELAFNSSENHKLVAEAIQEMWRHELGVETHLVNQENKVLQDARRSGNYQILRSSWIADYADPSSFLGIWTSDSGNNYTGWKNADYDRIVYEAARTTSPDARNALYQKAEAILLNEAPMVPIYFYTHTFLITPSVKGWYPNNLDHHPYKYVWLEP